MNQRYPIIVIINIALWWEAACQSHIFDVTEDNRHKRQMDFKYALFLKHFFYHNGILQVESTWRWHTPWAAARGCFSWTYTPTQSLRCTYYFVYIFPHARMVWQFMCLKSLRGAFVFRSMMQQSRIKTLHQGLGWHSAWLLVEPPLWSVVCQWCEQYGFLSLQSQWSTLGGPRRILGIWSRHRSGRPAPEGDR